MSFSVLILCLVCDKAAAQPQVLRKMLLQMVPCSLSTLTKHGGLTCVALTFVSITSGLVVLCSSQVE